MNRARISIAIVAWIVLIGIFAMVYKLVYRPHKAEQAVLAEQKKQQDILNATSGASRYDITVDFAIDSFCGFGVLRTTEFQNELAKSRIRINLIDDGADYPARIKAFKSGKVQMGVFTADALIRASSEAGGTPPAVIIAFVDETRGADAMVAYKEQFPNLDALNDPTVKFVLPSGPSDTLTRVIISHFHLTNLKNNPFVTVNDAKDVFENWRKSSPKDKQAYVLWEPWVSKMTDNPNMHVLVDSSKFHGYIMDVIVANREYMAIPKNQDTIKAIVAAYLKVLYQYRDTMPQLLVEDGKKTDSPLNAKEAVKIANGIWWKNTTDNYAQMGLGGNDSSQHVEDILTNIIHVLVSTKAISSDPSNGHMNLFYYDGILRSLRDSNFHPGDEAGRDESKSLPVLSDEQWGQLQPIGRLNVPPLSFARGTSNLSGISTQALDDLLEKLKVWPAFYIQINGNYLNVGDADANLVLAKSRAESVLEYLVSRGINRNRVHAVAGKPGDASSVTFVLGQTPY